MKILFVISSFQAGGAERVGAWLLGRLAGAGLEVVAATLSARDFYYPIDPRIRTVKLGVTKRPRDFLDALASTRRRTAAVGRLARAESPDLVLSFMTAPNLLAIDAARRLGLPVIVAERNSRRAAIVTPLQELRRRFRYPLASAVVVQTEADRADYPFLRNAHAIPNPVAAHVAASRARSPLILAAGRLERQKGFDILIEAFSLIRPREGWRLVIAGEGDERGNLEAQAARLGLMEKVEFLGHRRDLPELYAEASVFCLASRFEGFPNVLVEAMAAGCAVAAFDCPTGPREIIRDGVDGLLVPKESPAALASALERLITDPRLRESLGAEALSVRNRFSQDSVFSRWLELIRSVAGPLEDPFRQTKV